MDGRKYLALVLLVCGMVDVAVGMGGIRFPRKNILSLTDFKNALTPCVCFLLSLWNWTTSKEGKDGKAGSTWYEMLFGGALTEDNVLYNVKLTFTWQSSNQLLIEYIGNTFNSQACSHNQAYPLLTVYQTDKAAFVDAGGNYHVFVSSNPDEYLIMFTCYDGVPDIKNRVCSVQNMNIILMVKNQRPDSFPFMAAVNDLKRNTDGAIAFDSNIPTSLGVPFQFIYEMLEDHNC